MKLRVQAKAQQAPTSYDCVLPGCLSRGKGELCAWMAVCEGLANPRCSMIHCVDVGLVSAATFHE